MKTSIGSMLLALGLSACGGGGGGVAPATQAARPSPFPATASELPREPLGDVRVVASPSASPVVAVRIVFDGGSAEDPPGREGATNLAARLMVEGGAGELSYAELSRRLFPMAAELGFQVDRDQTAFVARVHRDHLEEFYPLLRDVLLRPRMAAADFERIREQVRVALTQELRGNDDEGLGKELLQAMLYERHPYAHPALGLEQALAAMTLDDVRGQREAVLCGPRATLGVAGGYPEGFVEQLRGDLASLRTERCQGRRRLPSAPAEEAARAWIVDKPEARSVAVSMGFHTEVNRAHPDYAALTLAAAYLGQHRQFIGLLMQKIREQRGINYGDYAYAEHFVQAGRTAYPLPNTARRAQYFSVWLRPIQPDRAHFSIRLAVRELRRLHAEGMSRADFERVRAYLRGYLALYVQTESRRLGFAIDDAFYGTERAYLEHLRGAWDSMGVEDVNAAVRRHLDPALLQLAIVGPDAAGMAQALASEAPSPIEYAADVAAAVRAEDTDVMAVRLGIPEGRIRVLPLEQVFRGGP